MWQKYINRKFMGTRLAGESKKQTSTSLTEAGEVTAELCGPAEDVGDADGLRWGLLKET